MTDKRKYFIEWDRGSLYLQTADRLVAKIDQGPLDITTIDRLIEADQKENT